MTELIPAVNVSDVSTNSTTNGSLVNESVPKVANIFNETVPDTTMYTGSWYAYTVFLFVLAIYSLVMSYYLFKAIIDSQSGIVSKCSGFCMAIFTVMVLLGIGLILRLFLWLTSYTSLMRWILAVDVVCSLVEAVWLCIKSAFSTTATLCNLLFLLTMDVVEIIIVTVMMQAVNNWCEDLTSTEWTICSVTLPAVGNGTLYSNSSSA